MAIKCENVSYGDQVGFFAAPARAKAPLPGVIVIQEVGGVNDNIEDITRRIAAAGYAALAPDLFAVKGERPPQLTKERISQSFAAMYRMPAGAMRDPALREATMAAIPEPERSMVAETQAAIFGSIGRYGQLPALPARGPALPSPRKAGDEGAEGRLRGLLHGRWALGPPRLRGAGALGGRRLLRQLARACRGRLHPLPGHRLLRRRGRAG